MAAYHVGCGITAIWAGTLNKAGDKWSNKSEVTDEACSAVAQWLLQEDKSMTFNYKGELHVLHVDKMDKGGDDDQTAST